MLHIVTPTAALFEGVEHSCTVGQQPCHQANADHKEDIGVPTYVTGLSGRSIMQSWHIRAGQSLSGSSSSIPHAQQPLSSNLLHFSQSYGLPRRQQKQRLLGLSGVDPSSTRPAAGISTNAHRTAVYVQQRPSSTQEHLNHTQHSSHHHRQLKDDGSLKVGLLTVEQQQLLLERSSTRHGPCVCFQRPLVSMYGLR